MTLRVMWLLNHGTARKFDLAMLRRIGVHEIFTPKHFPQQINFRSASIDLTTDDNLTIPAADLAILNAADWYRSPGAEAWKVANRYFQVLFFIAHDVELVESVAKNFSGALIWRAFGLDKTMSYTKIIDFEPRRRVPDLLKDCANRFWMGNSYSHLLNAEGPHLKARAVYLPLGMYDCEVRDEWTGTNKLVYFVCPDIGFNPYYQKVYEDFTRDFSDFDRAIGGSQPVPVSDPHVLGYLPMDEHHANMREFRVMFYHSTEPNHIHYHPFEAIRAGMPVVFMAGGLLDTQGGIGQPGRCLSIAEARRKVGRILADDRQLIDDIRKNQIRLLDPMRIENCESAWHAGFDRILEALRTSSLPNYSGRPPPDRKRIAVVLPVGYRGGTLRAAKLLAHAISEGSAQSGESAEIVLAHLDDPLAYPDEEFDDLPKDVRRRAFKWILLDAGAARRAMRYAGHDDWEPAGQQFIAMDDQLQQFLDCDLWVIVSDRLSRPLLPLRPYVCVVYDYLQRYEAIMPAGADLPFLDAARQAARVLVTTKFTENDALEYAGVSTKRVRRVPMLAPAFQRRQSNTKSTMVEGYFLWTTNAALHKNHVNTMLALQEYYENLDGQLSCRVTGVNTKNLLKGDSPHLAAAGKILASSQVLRRRIKWLGELSDRNYQAVLGDAAFLWHTARIDNGTFSVVEAAHLGVASLSSDYPAMREIDDQFSLNIQWMAPDRPEEMAQKLKWMEIHHLTLRDSLPGSSKLSEQSVEQLAPNYWRAIRDCL